MAVAARPQTQRVKGLPASHGRAPRPASNASCGRAPLPGSARRAPARPLPGLRPGSDRPHRALTRSSCPRGPA